MTRAEVEAYARRCIQRALSDLAHHDDDRRLDRAEEELFNAAHAIAEYKRDLDIEEGR